MKKITRNLVVATVVFYASLTSLKAQVNNPKIANDLTTLINKSSDFKSYKVIEKSAILDFQSSVNIFIQQVENTQSTLNEKLNANEKTISALQNQLKEYKTTNEILVNEKANISFLGFSIDKNSYSLFMWSLFLGTLLVLGVVIIKFNKVNKLNKNSKSVIKDIEEEYESYRRVCIEREQNLNRQLFTEKKKNKELKSVS